MVEKKLINKTRAQHKLISLYYILCSSYFRTCVTIFRYSENPKAHSLSPVFRKGMPDQTPTPSHLRKDEWNKEILILGNPPPLVRRYART